MEKDDQPFWIGDPMVRLEKAFGMLVSDLILQLLQAAPLCPEKITHLKERLEFAAKEIKIVQELINNQFNVHLNAQDEQYITDFSKRCCELSNRLTHELAESDKKNLVHELHQSYAANMEACLDVFRRNFIETVIRRQIESDEKAMLARKELKRISKQIFYVSLNASIEASRAGEYGTAFEVICQEIRRLAIQADSSLIDL